MLELHYHPGNANLAPHVLLEELGVPYRLAYVDRAVQAHKSAEYLALNPNGQIPVLIDRRPFGRSDRRPLGHSDMPLVIYETAAICLHLADTHDQPALAPPLGTPERAQFYKWLVWLTNTLQATLMAYFYPERWVAEGHAAAAAEVKAAAEQKVAGMLDQIDTQLALHGGPWMLGETYSALDPYVLMLGRWTRGFDRPARHLPHLGPYLERMLQREAVVRAFTREALPRPWI